MLQSRQAYLLAKDALHYMSSSDKREGKTYSLLLHAKKKATDGEYVVIICASYMQANQFEELLTSNPDSPLFMYKEEYERVKLTTANEFYFKGAYSKIPKDKTPYIITDSFAQEDLLRSLLQNCIDLQEELSELRDKQRKTQQLTGELVEIWGL